MPSANPHRSSADMPRECVALVHGFLANTSVMWLLGRRLRNRGYRTKIWGYWNHGCSLLVHADRFAKELAALDADPSIDRIHLVGHSMGGIVELAALDRYRPSKMGRLVMLGSPSRGSFVATRMASTFGRLLKPVAELTTAPDSLVNRLPMPEGVEIGAIAAKYDALVSEESTHPEAPHEHVVLPTWHTGLVLRSDAADLVAGFLATGRFPLPDASRSR